MIAWLQRASAYVYLQVRYAIGSAVMRNGTPGFLDGYHRCMVIIDKNGHKKTVYVRMEVAEKKVRIET